MLEASYISGKYGEGFLFGSGLAMGFPPQGDLLGPNFDRFLSGLKNGTVKVGFIINPVEFNFYASWVGCLWTVFTIVLFDTVFLYVFVSHLVYCF